MGRQFRVSISKPETHPRDMTRPSTSESSQEVNGTEEAFRQFVPKAAQLLRQNRTARGTPTSPSAGDQRFSIEIAAFKHSSACTYRSPRTLGPSRGKIAAARWSLSHICHPGSVESVVRTRRTKKAPANLRLCGNERLRRSGASFLWGQARPALRPEAPTRLIARRML
jgi:hypothetical protein